jgi:hypothetical protein
VTRRARIRRAAPHAKRRFERYSEFDNARLGDLAGTEPTARIARLMGRGPEAIRRQAAKCGYSLEPISLSVGEVAAAFGVCKPTVVRAWIRTGLLQTFVWAGHRGRGPQHRATAEAVETFIHEHPWAYDPARMPAGELRHLAYRAQGDGWMNSTQAAAEAYCSEWVVDTYMTQGLIQTWHRVGVGRVIPRSFIPTLAEMVEANRPAARAERRKCA